MVMTISGMVNDARAKENRILKVSLNRVESGSIPITRAIIRLASIRFHRLDRATMMKIIG